jgi:Flp pilus assembly protein TadG
MFRSAGSRVRALIHRFLREAKANVATIFALAAVPMLFLTGMGIDYGFAADRQSQLNAFADAAALAAVTPTLMAGTTSASQTAAQNTFNAQASTLAGVTYNPSNLTVTVSTSGSVRTVTVSYTAQSQNAFPNILGMNSITLSGSSTATAGLAPNIDFYLLLDSSPSMALPASVAGINSMVSLTSAQGGCAFACHQTSTGNGDTTGNPYWNQTSGQTCSGAPTGKRNDPNAGCVQMDNYQVARTNNITLRIDLLRTATQNLMSTAQATETKYNSSYRMAIYTFDVNFTKIQALTSNLTTAASSAGNISLLEVYSNNLLTASNNNDDTDTDFDNALSSINTAMPNPGSGTNTAKDTPQEVLFIVTDGMEDEAVSSYPSLSSAYGSYYGSRQQSTVNPLNASGGEPDTDWCATIKNRGIRIAVLYTEYLAIPDNSWYASYVAPLQNGTDNIGARLEACASPGLYYEVTTDGDISAALTQLFQLAVQSAYLSK